MAQYDIVFVRNIDGSGTAFSEFVLGKAAESNMFLTQNPTTGVLSWSKYHWLASGNNIYYNAGNVGFGAVPSSGAKVEVEGIVEISSQLRHRGDTDTYLNFENDLISMVAGNRQMLSASFAKRHLGFNWNAFSKALVWPNVYDTRQEIYNAFLNSGDMLVNLIQRGGSVATQSGIGSVLSVEIYRTGVSTGTVLNGGTGYEVDQKLYLRGGDSDNAYVVVESVGLSGEVLTIYPDIEGGSGYYTGVYETLTDGSGRDCLLYVKAISGNTRVASSGQSWLDDGGPFKTPGVNSCGWSGVNNNDPVEIEIDLASSMHIYRYLLVPAGRNQMPIDYKLEVYTNDAYYGFDRWHLFYNATGETSTYIKLMQAISGAPTESIRKLRLTVYQSGDADQSERFSIQNIIGYERYIGNGRFTGYNLSSSGDIAYGNYDIIGKLRVISSNTDALRLGYSSSIYSDFSTTAAGAALLRTYSDVGLWLKQVKAASIANEDVVGQITMFTETGGNGSASLIKIQAVATENHSSSAYGTALLFGNTENGEVQHSNRFMLDKNGNLVIKTSGISITSTLPEGKSGLDVHDSVGFGPTLETSTNVTLGDAYCYMLFGATADRQFTLPDRASCAGRNYMIINASVGYNLSILRSGTDKANGGNPTITLATGDVVFIHATSNANYGWFISNSVKR